MWSDLINLIVAQIKVDQDFSITYMAMRHILLPNFSSQLHYCLHNKYFSTKISTQKSCSIDLEISQIMVSACYLDIANLKDLCSCQISYCVYFRDLCTASQGLYSSMLAFLLTLKDLVFSYWWYYGSMACVYVCVCRAFHTDSRIETVCCFICSSIL